jgi:hypothetical protein
MKRVTWNGQKDNDHRFVVIAGETFYKGQARDVPNHVAKSLEGEKNFTIRDTPKSASSDKKSSEQEDIQDQGGGPGGSGPADPDPAGTGTGAAAKGRTP